MEERREQLLELGHRAFTQTPYDEVSTDRIAEEAGISRGLIFHYFPTKRDFYVAVLERVSAELLAVTFARQEGTPLERLVAGLHAYFRFVERHGTPFTALLRGGVGSDPVVFAVTESTRARFVEKICENFPGADLARDPSLRASLRGFLGMVEALALDWLDHRDLTHDEVVALSVRGFLALVPNAPELALAHEGGLESTISGP